MSQLFASVVQDEFLGVERLQRRLNDALLGLLALTLLTALTLTVLLAVLALPGLLLLGLILPGLLRLGVSEDCGQREQRRHDEGGTGAEVHADDPYPAEGTAVVLGVDGKGSHIVG